MPSNQEIEIKFRIADVPALNRRLRDSGFKLITKPTHEVNTLYDFPKQALRERGDMLRLRKFGEEWVLTYKAKGLAKAGPHKKRTEYESIVSDGNQIGAILRALDLSPAFRYEKFRAEWSDDKGHVVVDQTPIGNFGEIEGPSRWIDQTARSLKIPRSDYIVMSYGELFADWKKRSRSAANEMTFKAIGRKKPAQKS
jgi:adenylate cyclase, class 2